MKKLFYSSTIVLLAALLLFALSCNKNEVQQISILKNEPTLLQYRQVADGIGNQSYYFLKHDVGFKTDFNDLSAGKLDSLKTFIKTESADLKGLDFESSMDKLMSKNYLSQKQHDAILDAYAVIQSDNIEVKEIVKALDAKEDIIYNRSDMQKSEKLLTLLTVAVMKNTTRYLVENNNFERTFKGKAQPRDCFLGSTVACWLGTITVSTVIGFFGGGLNPPTGTNTSYTYSLSGSGPIVGAFQGFVQGIYTAATSCNCGATATCNGAMGTSFNCNQGCQPAATVNAYGGDNSAGSGWDWNYNSHCYSLQCPGSLHCHTQTSFLNIVQTDPSDFTIVSNPTCDGTKQRTDIENLNSFIHDPGSVYAINGNSYPYAGSYETYFISSNNSQGRKVVIEGINGSIGTFVQTDNTILVHWFRSGSGIIKVHNRSACGEESDTFSYPITVQ